MKRFLIGFVAIVTLVAFFSSALAIDRAPKESKAKDKDKPTEFKEGKKTDVREGKTKGIVTPERKSEKIRRETKEEVKVKGTDAEKLTKWLKSRKKQKAKEKYDYFIDKNNNGIDDRLEGKKPKKPVSPTAIRPVPKEKQPAKSAPSIKKTSEKKKVKPAPKKNEVKKAKKIEGKKRR